MIGGITGLPDSDKVGITSIGVGIDCASVEGPAVGDVNISVVGGSAEKMSS